MKDGGKRKMENPFKIEPKKNMATVADYNKKRQLEMFRFSCFNASAAIHSGMRGVNVVDVLVFAEALYNEALERDYLKLEVKK